jgi:hypothetical protein
MITQEQIDEAAAAVEAAELVLDRAEAHHATAGSETAVAELRAAKADSHAARDKVRQLRTRHAAEQAASRARATAEGEFPARERKAVTRRLTAAKDVAADAVARAEQVAAEMLAAVAAYDAAVRETAAELKCRGLSADGGLDGGAASGVVHLDGETWRPADPSSLLAAIASSAVAARDPHHPFGQQRWRHLGGAAAVAGRDALRARAVAR